MEGLPSREWTALPADDSKALAERLKSTSIFEVTGEDANGKPGLLLVQEIGMFRKPSLAPERTAADILKDWAAPSDDRRVEMFEGMEGVPAAPAEQGDRRPEEELASVASLSFLKKEKEEEIEVDPVNVYVAYWFDRWFLRRATPAGEAA